MHPITDNPLVCLKDIYFKYDKEYVVEDIDLHIERGEYLGLLGPNGSGKSTLLKLILGLVSPEKGSVELFGVPLKKFRQWSKIGYIPQKATQIDFHFPITVSEVVGLTTKDDKEIRESLEKVGMTEYSHVQVRNLSGGQQQKVFIAKALAGKPELLLLDEPTVGIDQKSQQEFYALLSRLHHSGLTIVLVSHDTDNIAKEVERIVCVNKTLVCHVNAADFIKGKYQDKLYGEDRKSIIHHHVHA